MKKITIVSLQKNGGAPLDTLELSNALIREKTAHVLILSSGNELREHFTHEPFREIIYVETFASDRASFLKATVLLARPIKLLGALRRSRPDVIFSSHFHPWLFLIRIFQLFSKTQWWYSIHESPFWNKENRGSFENSLERWFLRASDRIFCYSMFIAKNLAESLPGKRITPLVLGAYQTGYDLRNSGAPSLLPEKKNIRILSAGRIEPHKGLGTLVESFLLIPKGSAELVIAGRGTLPEHMPKDRPDIVVINRWLTVQEIGRLYESADIIAISHYNASQSGSPPWAMATGKPIVATHTGAIAEQVRNGATGIIVESKNKKELSEALVRLIENPEERACMGLAAHQLGMKEMSWDANAKTLARELSNG